MTAREAVLESWVHKPSGVLLGIAGYDMIEGYPSMSRHSVDMNPTELESFTLIPEHIVQIYQHDTRDCDDIHEVVLSLKVLGPIYVHLRNIVCEEEECVNKKLICALDPEGNCDGDSRCCHHNNVNCVKCYMFATRSPGLFIKSLKTFFPSRERSIIETIRRDVLAEGYFPSKMDMILFEGGPVTDSDIYHALVGGGEMCNLFFQNEIELKLGFTISVLELYLRQIRISGRTVSSISTGLLEKCIQMPWVVYQELDSYPKTLHDRIIKVLVCLARNSMHRFVGKTLQQFCRLCLEE